jgi:hypothetical protein
MISRLIRIGLAAIFVFAAIRVGQSFMAHYTFADEIDQIAQRGVRTDEEEVRSAIAEAAARLNTAVDPAKVAVRVQGEHVYIDLRYTRAIEVLPRLTYPWEFEVNAHGWVVPSGGVKPK